MRAWVFGFEWVNLLWLVAAGALGQAALAQEAAPSQNAFLAAAR